MHRPGRGHRFGVTILGQVRVEAKLGGDLRVAHEPRDLHGGRPAAMQKLAYVLAQRVELQLGRQRGRRRPSAFLRG